MAKKLRRVFVYEDFYEEVKSFARSRWDIKKERGPNGSPLYRSFPASLERYVEFKCGGGD